MDKKEYIIDASDKRVGRISTEAATILNGKNSPDYERNKVPEVTVLIKNASKVKIYPTKFIGKKYLSYSGYPGGQKIRTMQQVIDSKGFSEVIRKSIYGMLPSNKLRSRKMNLLQIEEN